MVPGVVVARQPVGTAVALVMVGYARCRPRRCMVCWGVVVPARWKDQLLSAAAQAEARCGALAVVSWTGRGPLRG